MSAARLREAAALMRERAEAATPGPWTHRSGSGDVEGADETSLMDYPDLVDADAAHIASWHPAVAVAVADWLDGVALFVEAKDDEEYFDLDGDPIAAEDTHAIGCAIAVADAYLGDPS